MYEQQQQNSAMAERWILSLGTVLLKKQRVLGKTLLVLDNGCTHSLDDLEDCSSDSGDIWYMFLPANTSFHYPVDQGVIEYFK